MGPSGLVSMLAVLALASAAGAKDGPPIVVTSSGRLEGKQWSVRGLDRPVYNYLAIPFAKPPVGPWRFSVPVAPDTWSGTRKATEFPLGCLQDSILEDMMKDFMKIETGPRMYSEDCLYLNVHTPVPPHDTKTRLSVMVWIHGGGFWVGSGKFYDGSALAAYENVVVVVIQYRLGVPGFLSTGDEHLRANLGMLDQIAALKWIQGNIESFGGDPSSVTIFGESAGGVSVSLLLVSPLATGLFHRAISESGTALFKGLINTDLKATTQMIANKTGCGMETSLEFVSCLRNMSEEEMLNLTKSSVGQFAPIVVDGSFLSKEVEHLLEAKEFNVVPYLLGVNNHEAGWILAKMLNSPGWEEGMDRETSAKIIRATKFLTEEELQRTLDEYMGHTQDRTEIRDLHLDILGDIFMLIPTIRSARLCRDAGSPVFLYEFQHRTSIFNTTRPDFVKADHGDEIGYVFGSSFWNGDIIITVNGTAEEVDLSRRMMKYWANFAKNGNPNGEGLELWPAYDQNESYMQLNLKPKAGTKLKEHRVRFFIKILGLHVSKESEQTPAGDKDQHQEL